MNPSVSVQVWNEAALLGAFVSHLRTRLPAAEILLGDGARDDFTRSTVARHHRTSARHYEEYGRYRTTLFYLLILGLYLLRVSPDLLARCHRRFTAPRAAQLAGGVPVLE